MKRRAIIQVSTELLHSLLGLKKDVELLAVQIIPESYVNNDGFKFLLGGTSELLPKVPEGELIPIIDMTEIQKKAVA